MTVTGTVQIWKNMKSFRTTYCFSVFPKAESQSYAHMDLLEAVEPLQCTALRTTLVCRLRQYLHCEACMLLVCEHLYKQFSLRCFHHNHPYSQRLWTQPPPTNVKNVSLHYFDKNKYLAIQISGVTNIR